MVCCLMGAMRRIVRLGVVVIALGAPGLAVADDKVVDCAQSPATSVTADDSSYVFKGACKFVGVNGDRNVVTIESVDVLQVLGGKNKITVRVVDSLDLDGKWSLDNEVVWKSAKSGGKPTLTGSQISKNKVTRAR